MLALSGNTKSQKPADHLSFAPNTRPAKVQDLFSLFETLKKGLGQESDTRRGLEQDILGDICHQKERIEGKKNFCEHVGHRIAAQERLQSFINDIQHALIRQDVGVALKAVASHQGAVSEEIHTEKKSLDVCVKNIEQCEKQIPEDYRTLEVKRVRKVAKCILLEDAMKLHAVDRSRYSDLRSALTSYRLEITAIEEKLSHAIDFAARFSREKIPLIELRLNKGMKDDVSSHIVLLENRFKAVIALTQQVQKGQWREASESFRHIMANESDSLVMNRRIKQSVQAELQKHHTDLQNLQKVLELVSILFEADFRSFRSKTDDIQTEWLSNWEAIEASFKGYLTKRS